MSATPLHVSFSSFAPTAKRNTGDRTHYASPLLPSSSDSASSYNSRQPLSSAEASHPGANSMWNSTTGTVVASPKGNNRERLTMAPHGYNLHILIQSIQNLPRRYFHTVDPYIRVFFQGVDIYRTDVVRLSQNPVFDEEVRFVNMLPGCSVRFEVWDKDQGQDTLLGVAEYKFLPQTLTMDKTAEMCIALSGGRFDKKGGAHLLLQITASPSIQPGLPKCGGLKRWMKSYSLVKAIATSLVNLDTDAACAFKVFFTHIPEIFRHKQTSWNKDYDAARRIFSSSTSFALKASLRSQHAFLYATEPPRLCDTGTLCTADDFFKLFRYGRRRGEMRYFTYVLMADSFRCSETGKTVLCDMISKHAMHSNVAEEVYYAGEFCIHLLSNTVERYKLVIDNNSGTYSPCPSGLDAVARVFTHSFPDMVVEAVDFKDPKLKYYHSLVPSR